VLRCIECGTTSDRGFGWRAYVVRDPDQDDDAEAVAIYCDVCAEREFGARPHEQHHEAE
jgi:hypothetical protein